jgi:23S rRNA (guanosine2251-2'-O)-methyltransferase
MIIYGLRPVLYYLTNFPADVSEVYLSRRDRLGEIRNLTPKNVRITIADEQYFQRRFTAVNHQGFAAMVSDFKYYNLDELDFDAGSLALILDGIKDPANLGAIMRTAEAFSVDAVIIPKDRAASVTPAVIRASSGAARGVRVCMAVNIARAINGLKDKGFWVAAVDIQDDAMPFYKYDMTGSVAFILGAEGKGIRRLPLEQADIVITIPLTGRVESLNVSAAAAAILSEASRQRSMKRLEGK